MTPRDGVARNRRRSRTNCAIASPFNRKGGLSRASASSNGPVRPRNARPVGFLQRHRELLAHLSGRRPGAAADADRLLAGRCLMFIDESHVAISQVGGMYKGDRSRKNPVRLWFPVAIGARQPSAQVRRTKPCYDDDIVFGDAGRYEANTRGQSSSRSCARPRTCRSRSSSCVRRRRGSMICFPEVRTRIALYERSAGDHAHQAHVGGVDRVPGEHGVRCVISIPISIPSSASRSSAIFAWASSTSWSASTCCVKGSTFPRCRWSRSRRDKEGFLRSERSLIQTVGRAARHSTRHRDSLRDRVTGSMQRAISRPSGGGQTDSLQRGERRCSERRDQTHQDIIDGVYDAETAQREHKAAQQRLATRR